MDKRPAYHHRDHALAVAFVLLLLFLTPFTRLWLREAAPWYLPYLVWGGVILLLLLLRLLFRPYREGR